MKLPSAAVEPLSAEVESGSGHKARLGVSYLTRGLSWSADYTATLAPESQTMGLECWGTVTNQTGTEFPNAKLSFVAGSPNRAVTDTGRKARDMSGFDGDIGVVKKSWKMEGGGFQTNTRFESPEAAGELYAYPYKVAATIRPDQMNRVRMMGSDEVKIVRDYAIRLGGFDTSNFYTRPEQRLTATLSLKFKNTKDAGLGLPLPSGAVRVYEPSPSGTVRYIGAATIGDTPTDADVSATLTNVFDVYAQTKLVATKRVDRHTTSRLVEVLLHNEKAHDVKVRLVQDFWGKWKVAEETFASKRLNANSAQWEITVPKGGTTKLNYKVLLNY